MLIRFQCIKEHYYSYDIKINTNEKNELAIEYDQLSE